MRLAFRVWADKVFDDGRTLNVHDVTTAMLATVLHITTPPPRTRIGSLDALAVSRCLHNYLDRLNRPVESSRRVG